MLRGIRFRFLYSAFFLLPLTYRPYAPTDSRKKKVLNRVGAGGANVQRFKGLGEMNPDQLWETTMDPDFRTLLKVNINDFFQSETIFDTLMGSDSNKRKTFILENALNVKNLDI